MGLKVMPGYDAFLMSMVNKDSYEAAESSGATDWMEEVHQTLEVQGLRYCEEMRKVSDALCALYSSHGMEV